MKRLISIFLALFGIAANSMAADLTPSQMSDKLRLMVLNLNPKEIGITRETFPHEVFALIMETGFPEGSYTLASVADGTTSLYFSNGGGIIGGGEHENVRKASSHFLSSSQDFYRKAKLVKTFPRPESGKVIFYFITFNGVKSYSALENELGNRRDNLSNLFYAAHNVIAELRKMKEQSHHK